MKLQAAALIVQLAVLPSVDFSPALNSLEQVRFRVDPRSGKVVKRRRTAREKEREQLCALMLRSAQQIAHQLGER